MEGIVHLLGNSLVVYPLTRQILSAEQRFPNVRTRKFLALGFLLLMGLFSVGYRFNEILSSRNAFHILGVSRSSSVGDIRKAYKNLAVSLHPDRQRENANADEEFMDLKLAYDQLLNEDFREIYDQWGEAGFKLFEKSAEKKTVFFQGLLKLLVQYMFLLGSTFLSTFMMSSNEIILTNFALNASLLMIYFAIEVDLRYNGTAWLVIPFANWLTIDQMMNLLVATYFTFVSGILAFQNLVFEKENNSLEKLSFQSIQVLIMQQKEMQMHLLEMDEFLSRKLGKKRVGVNQEDVNINLDLGEPDQTKNDGNINNMSGSSLPRNLRAKIKGNQFKAQAPRQTASTGIPRWVFMIAIYVAIQYFFK